MSERRYTDQEMAEIFRAATESPGAQRPPVARDDGLTLADLQAIGGEVGISADAVARAAFALDVRVAAARRTMLGLPIVVSRTVDLHRRLGDDEWERFVVRLREVFDAPGRTRAEGSFRQWSNGNLRVLLEPTDDGHRLRFATTNGGARTAITMGLTALGVAASGAVALAIAGTLGAAIPGLSILGFAGAGMLASGAARLPRWARLRGRQMDALAAQVAMPAAGALPPTARASGGLPTG